MKVIKQDGKKKLFIMEDGTEVPFSEIKKAKSVKIKKGKIEKIEHEKPKND